MLRPQAASFLSRRHILIAVVTVTTLWYLTFHDTTGLGAPSDKLSGVLPWTQPVENEKVLKEQFVAKALEKDIYVSEYNGTALRKLCNETEWRDNVVASCDKLGGGIGNLKVNLLACIRYVIESGAKLIPPVIHVREDFGLMSQSFNWDDGTDLSYMFDTKHLYRTLAADCPQLHFVNEKDPALHIPPKSEAVTVNPKTLLPAPWMKHVLSDPSRFRPTLDALIESEITEKNLEPTAVHPVRLTFNDGISFSWPTAYDSDAFAADFGHLAVVPHRIRALSARILYRLYQKLNTGAPQEPDRPSRDLFLGAHIRTESDAAVEGWTSFETQATHVRDQAVAARLGAVYVATGTASDAARLSEFLADVQVPAPVNETTGEEQKDYGLKNSAPVKMTGVRVWQKWDFVDDDDLLLMDSLTWDQMALIDLDVMLRASRFVGIWESSWSWTIALRRHAWSEEDPYDYEAHPLTFEDGLSTIYGPAGAQPIIAPCLWL